MMNRMDDLPENLLLKIFEYLAVKELCIAGRVCRQWRRIVRDNTLWRHVDLLNYRLDLKKMWKLIRSHLSECLLSIKIKGFLDTGKPKFGAYSLSDAMLKDLKERCPNLKEIHLKNCNTMNLDPSLLPSGLVKLTLENCAIEPGLMKHFTRDLPELSYLDVSRTVRFDDRELSYVCGTDQLKVLIMNGCYRVTAEGLSKAAQQMASLERMEIGDAAIENKNQNFELAAHHMTRHMVSLKHLNLQGCKPLTSDILKVLLSGLKKLETLNVACCLMKYDSFVNMEPYLKKIKLLEICSSEMGHQQVEDLESILLECSVKMVRCVKSCSSAVVSS